MDLFLGQDLTGLKNTHRSKLDKNTFWNQAAPGWSSFQSKKGLFDGKGGPGVNK